MRKLFLIFLLGLLAAFPYSASAQNDAALSFVAVQLWPEYDQPSMLVIVDFQPAANTSLPAVFSFRIPAEADLIAVASDAGGGQFLNAPYENPVTEGEYQTFKISVETNRPYRFEYYQPLAFNGSERLFTYLWDDGYAVENFHYIFLEPLDTASLNLDPEYASTETSNGLNSYSGTPVQLDAGGQYILTVKYKKTTDILVSQGQTVQIAEPINEDTPGRVSLANSLPYIIGALGIVLIAGGLTYYFQWGGVFGRNRPRRRMRPQSDAASVYCPQCGSRAKPSDRFCRACGARLRHEE